MLVLNKRRLARLVDESLPSLVHSDCDDYMSEVTMPMRYYPSDQAVVLRIILQEGKINVTDWGRALDEITFTNMPELLTKAQKLAPIVAQEAAIDWRGNEFQVVANPDKIAEAMIAVANAATRFVAVLLTSTAHL